MKEVAYFKIEYKPEDYTAEQVESIIRKALPRTVVWRKTS